MNEKKMADEMENSSLKLRLERLEAQVHQHLKLEKDVREKPLRLQMEVAKKLKTIKRLKYRADVYRQEISDKDISLKKMEDYIKTIWNLLLVFGNKLEKVGELAVNEQNQLQNKYRELFAIGVSQNKGDADVFDILRGLPVSSLEILSSPETCTKNFYTEFNQVIDKEKNIALSNYSSSAFLTPRNVPSSNESLMKTDLTSQNNMSQTLFNKKVKGLKDASYYPCLSDTLNHEVSRDLYAKESPSCVSSYQQLSFTGTLFNSGDFSSQYSNNPSNSDNAFLYKPGKVNCTNGEVEESLEQENFASGNINLPVKIMEPHSRGASQRNISDETLSSTYVKESSTSVSKVQPKLLTDTLLNVKDSCLKQLTDTSDSDNFAPCVSDELGKTGKDELIQDMPHDKDDESLQQRSCAVVDTCQPYPANVEDLFANTSDETLSHTYAKKPFSSNFEVQPELLTNSLLNIKDSSLKQLTDTSNSDNSALCVSDELGKTGKDELMQDMPHDKDDESLQQRSCAVVDTCQPYPANVEDLFANTSDETLSHTYAKKPFSSNFEVQPELLTNSLLNIKDSSLKQLTDTSDSDNFAPCVSDELGKTGKDELIQDMPHDKDDESLQQRSCAVVDTCQPYTANVEDLFENTSDETLSYTYAKKPSARIFEVEPKLLTDTLLNVKDASPKQLIDTTDSNNSTPCMSDEVPKGLEDELIQDMPHDKDDESLQQRSYAVVNTCQPYTKNVEDLFGIISDEEESEAGLSSQLTIDIEDGLMRQKGDFVSDECASEELLVIDLELSNDCLEAPDVSSRFTQQVPFQNDISHRNEELMDIKDSLGEHSRDFDSTVTQSTTLLIPLDDDVNNEESVLQEVVSSNKVADSEFPLAAPLLEDLALSDEDSDTGLSDNISKIPQDSILSNNHAQNECIKFPIKNLCSLTSIYNKKRHNSSCNVEEHNLESCTGSDSQGSTYFVHDSEEKGNQDNCINQTLQPTKKQKLSQSLSLTSPIKKAAVDSNIEPATFSTDSNTGYSNFPLSESDTGSENSINLGLNQSHFKEKEEESLTPLQQTWRRKRRFSRIYTFHINDTKSKRRKSAFVAGVCRNAPQTSQWNTKFKKINEQLKNDASLPVSNVNPNKLWKRNLKQYSVANIAENLDTSGELITIENSESEVGNNCGTHKEACTSKDTPTQPKVPNSIRCIPKIKHSLDKNQIISNNSDKEIIEGNYITYVKSKNVDLDKSNQNNQSKSNLTVTKRKKRRPCASQEQIKEFFQNFNEMELSFLNFKPTVQMLVRKLNSPRFFSNTSELLFHTLTYLFNSRKNPLLSYCVNEDSAVQIPLDENCIVTALFRIESYHPPHLEGILRRATTTIHHLVLSKKKFSMYSLGSLCRVLVEICKRQENSLKPVILCADLLKMRHPFATYLIATIAVVWKELFKIENNLPAEEVLFHSSILYGARKNIKHLTDSDRDISLKIIFSYFTAPIVKCAKSSIPFMKNLIEMRCQDDSWNSYYLTSALVILARHEDWDWVQDNLLTNFIIPNLNKFGRETLNEHAFDIFCNLYVDVFLLKPGNPLDTTLCKFINDSSTIESENFVKDCAALALIRFVYLKNRKLPTFLDSWLQENKQKSKVQQIESLFRKKKMGEDLKSLRLEDIL